MEMMAWVALDDDHPGWLQSCLSMSKMIRCITGIFGQKPQTSTDLIPLLRCWQFAIPCWVTSFIPPFKKARTKKNTGVYPVPLLYTYIPSTAWVESITSPGPTSEFWYGAYASAECPSELACFVGRSFAREGGNGIQRHDTKTYG